MARTATTIHSIMLTKTETILKVVERIKGVVGVNYKHRAKRSDDELKISKKHALVAKERVRHSFVTMELWGCKWTNWSDNFQPINIKGYCSNCGHPVVGYYLIPPDDELEPPVARTLGITCSKTDALHEQVRAKLDILRNITKTKSSSAALDEVISNAIISECNLRIAKEIKKLRLQFWR